MSRSTTGMYDYIVVGAGSAGCVLANRLSADPSTSVLLLEAGGSHIPPAVRTPRSWRANLKTEVDWGFTTEPQRGLDGRIVDYGQGKVLGGGSAINALAYVRGNRRDFDGWRDAGNPGWAYEDVLPYFRRSEDRPGGPSRYHGSGGPLAVTDPAAPHPLSSAYIEAAESVGHRANPDFNGEEQLGVGLFQLTIKDGRRHSSADAFLEPVLDRKNLTVVTDAQATRIEIERGTATGIACVRDGDEHVYRSSREVVLSAGAIGSPSLMLHSGLGPAGHLEAFGITIVVDLPGVGENLQEHAAVGVSYETADRHPVAEGSNGVEACTFMRSPRADGDTAPELQSMFFGATPDDGGEFVPGTSVITAHILRPVSRGTVRLRSADPLDAPAIDPNLLGDDADAEMLADGVEMAREIGRAPALASSFQREIGPGPSARTRGELIRFLREASLHTYHPVGTCKMGADEQAVVDHQLRVRGIEGLRVADASVMPTIVSGNTNAAAIMIGEKGADLILAG